MPYRDPVVPNLRYGATGVGEGPGAVPEVRYDWIPKTNTLGLQPHPQVVGVVGPNKSISRSKGTHSSVGVHLPNYQLLGGFQDRLQQGLLGPNPPAL